MGYPSQVPMRNLSPTFASDTTNTLTGLTLSHGLGLGDIPRGGGIYINSNAVLTVNDSTLIYNSTGFGRNNGGGGIYNNQGILTLNRSTLAHNRRTPYGSGICNYKGTIRLNNSTLAYNIGDQMGGGIYNNQGIVVLNHSTFFGNYGSVGGGGIYSSGTLLLTNTIVAGNLFFDCANTQVSAGHNLDSDGSCGLNQATDLSGVDPVLGPEMKSTGEVMGADPDFGVAYMKAQIAAGQKLPLEGKIFISVNDNDKRKIVGIAKRLAVLGYEIVSTSGTAEVLRKNGLEVGDVAKLGEGRPDVLDLIKNGEVKFLINTPGDKRTKVDETKIRSGAIMHAIPIVTTLNGARATVNGLEAVKKKGFKVKALQDYHK